MRALYCTADTVGEGGGGLLVRHEIQALKEMGAEVVVLDSSLLSPQRWRQPDSPFWYDYIASQLVRAYRFDIAQFYSGTFTRTVSWLKEQGAKVSYTVPAHERHLTVEEHERMGIPYPWHHIKDDDLWALFSEGYRLADLVIAQSELSARFLRNEGCRNVVVIYGGTEIPKRVTAIPDQFRAGYVGQVGVDKGLVYLIRAWAMLGYEDADLVLAGRGTEQLEVPIRNIADKGRFTLLGYVNSVSDVYNACSVLVQPSVCDAMPLEVPEAMAHGRPVIVSEGAGASEIVGHGNAGFVVPMRDPQAIAEKIGWLKSHPEELRRMGENGRKRARDFSWARVRARYTQAFSSLLP